MTTTEMTPPFFVVDGDDIMFCRSVEDLERFIEPVDAPNTTAYDVRGNVVHLKVVLSSPQGGGLRGWLRSGRPLTRAVASGVRNEAALEASLRVYLARVDPKAADASLADIVANLEDYGVRYS